ncbi:MAG: DNA internalization-related competence protein ComEC/Rec2 [Clostridiales bacterium]
MRRPLVYGFLSFVLSLIISRYLYFPLWFFLFLIPISAVLGVVLRYFKVPWIWAVLLLIFSLGLGYGEWREVQAHTYPWLPDEIYTVKGSVLGFPHESEDSLSFDFKVTAIGGVGENLKISVIADKDVKVAYGDVLQLQGTALFSNENVNPGGFDFNLYQKEKGISATFSTKYGGDILFTGEKDASLLLSTASWLRGKFFASLGYLPESQRDFISGVFLGDTQGMTQGDLDMLSKSGIRHCFSVSGLHVGYLILFLDMFFNLLHLKKKTRVVALVPLLMIYCALTGFHPGVVRSWLMCFMVYLAMGWGKAGDGFSALAAAGFILLLWNPQNLWLVSFQLSFIAMVSIIYFTHYFSGLFKKEFLGKDILIVTISAQIGLLPVIAYYFHTVSIISFFINSIACFLVGAVVVLAMGGLVLSVFSGFLGAAPLVLGGFIGEFIYWATYRLINLPFAYYYPQSFPLWALFLAYGLFFIIPHLQFLKHRKVLALSSLLMVLVFAVFPWQVLTKQDFEITFLDVGEGDCIFIATPTGENILVDAGSGKSNAIGVNRIRPFLLDRGVNHLDYIFVSHCDRDHVGSIPSIIEYFGAEKIVFSQAEYYFSKDLEALVQSQGTEVVKVESGDSLKIGGVDFDVMYPEEKVVGESNTLSMILKVKYQKFSALLTGDANEEAIATMNAQGLDLSADILKIPHHGSKTGYNEEFYQNVNPQAVVISVGKNSFGHPDQTILDYWRSRNIPIYRTEFQGAITVKAQGKNCDITTYLEK